MNADQVDLNLLFVFEALMQQRSVTKASDVLGLSQSATSAALARLRSMLDDPLFVKVGQQMEPTPRAASLTEPVRSVLETVRGSILQAHRFEPRTADRLFKLLMPDIGEVSLLPELLSRLNAEAPLITLKTLSLGRHAASHAMEADAVDLAIGYYPDLLKGGFFHQRLLGVRHVCVVGVHHPRVRAGLTLEDFLNEDHVFVSPGGREHVVEQFLNEQALRCRVRVRVAHFMSLVPLLQRTDLIATVPVHVAQWFVKLGGIRWVEAPVTPPVIDLYQFWHRRNHSDAGHAWLRAVIKDIYLMSFKDSAGMSQSTGSTGPAG